MKITNFLLEENPAEKTGVKLTTRLLAETFNPGPRYLIIHYTAMDDVEAVINGFRIPKPGKDNLAAHIVLDFDGTITQVVPFNHRANHSGSSIWYEYNEVTRQEQDFNEMNHYAIGIEIMNPGYIGKKADGSLFRDGKPCSFNRALRYTNIVDMQHKHRFQTGEDHKHWFAYPDEQMQALYKLSKMLSETYPTLKTVLGHDDISAGRKVDPGPSFDWDSFRAAVFGKASDTGKIFRVTQDDTSFRKSPKKAPTNIIRELPKGYEVGIIERLGEWTYIYLANTADEVRTIKKEQTGNIKTTNIKTTGWIHSSLLELKPEQL